ncbi:peptidoglycan/LPS O-acetylase OafA/YrhL [Mycolicibacterium sp. BK634]|uniref:hypothetical protein n=1 Tax=Mycolicibacterium sp. BK634 TaxID=2587099 RepID=UPI0016127F92|nr:hypothetical protein [Mycolicibacterium sp. BK634]MBB3750610.1 peptidoglycan/LPS O-acetylase OafA/YrhL [Mycolicibacterium sp. BK634]
MSDQPVKHRLDDQTWKVATWSTPILFQLVCGVFLAAMLIATKLGFRDDTRVAEGHKILAATGVAVLIALIVAAPFLATRRPSLRGLALGTATAAAIFLIGALGYVFWLS